MNNLCDDNRFEVIRKAKEYLLEATNIDTSADEMACLDSFLFRCWQVGWIDRFDETKAEPRKHGHWVVDDKYATYYGVGEVYKCDQCGYEIDWREHSEIIREIHATPEELDEKQKRYFCPHCGAKMDGKDESDGQ